MKLNFVNHDIKIGNLLNINMLTIHIIYYIYTLNGDNTLTIAPQFKSHQVTPIFPVVSGA